MYNGYGYSYPQYGNTYQQNSIQPITGGYQSYQTQQPVAQVQQTPQQIIKGRPVSSYDEAKASMIDMDGSMFVFPDIANKRIYTKQIMLDGSAELKVYALVEQTQPTETKQNNEQYVLRTDFDKAMGTINSQIHKIMEGMPYEPDANVKHDAK